MTAELDQLLKILEAQRKDKRIVFTNGCFDLLHAGHCHYLQKAKELGDILIVGLNSDSSIRRIKGAPRPIVPQDQRAFILSSLRSVDYVVIFEEDTPTKLIEAIKPDILVKGGDWSPESIPGRDFVESYGGKVITIPFEYQTSTSKIIERIKKLYCP